MVRLLHPYMSSNLVLTTAALHIYMAGVGVQQFFIIVFSITTISILRSTNSTLQGTARSNSTNLMYAVWTVLLLISCRIIFRICEYASGLNSRIPTHEAYQYCLDSLPMLLASVALNIVHPGRLMNGPGSNLPSRKERKQMGGQYNGPMTGCQDLPMAQYKGSSQQSTEDV